jgi:GalNAc-alpha-(1->4)-GalNAc-alpha-(1->3)-diNAcBac-PP-undecaprenol alpha-1,4-N-acetyl-D-galactosaminyltransferase
LYRKKYVFIIGALSFGGAERVICNLANEFSRNNHDVILIALHKREPSYMLNKEITVINGVNGNTPLLIAINLRKILKREKAQVVISFMTHINIVTIFSNLGLKSKVFISERSNPYMAPKQLTRKLLRDIFYPLASGVVFQTEDAQNYFSKKIKKKSVVIPNPVFIEEKLANFTKEKRIITVGRLVKPKRQDVLIKAFGKIYDKFPRYTLEIYGEGPEKENLNNLIAELDLEKSVFLRGVSKELHSKIRNAQLFVLTSEYEGMPNALMEAMALGIPSISTDCPIGGPKSVIDNMVNGILVPVNEEEKLVKSIDLLLSNEKLRNKISLESSKVKNNFSLQKIAKEWENFVDL